MKIRVTNTKTGNVTEMVTKREYKNCYHCIVTNEEHYKGGYRIYKDWLRQKHVGDFIVEEF